MSNVKEIVKEIVKEVVTLRGDHNVYGKSYP